MILHKVLVLGLQLVVPVAGGDGVPESAKSATADVNPRWLDDFFG
jgi:hypothetical protein